MKRIFLFLLFSTIFECSQAQILNDSLEYRIRPDSLKTGELHLSIYNFNYLRNYEYFNKIQDGYTLFGAQLEPQLIYYPHPRLAVTAGIHLRKDFGGVGIYKTYPLFSIKYQHGNTTLINGVLEGNIHHRLLEPIYDFEKKITEPVEYGTQFIINSKRLFLDAFINWKRMIYKPSPYQEQIIGGLSSELNIIKNPNLTLSLPLQFNVFHQGGQIDIVNVPLQTIVNTALGFKLKVPLDGWLRNFRTENYLLSYNELSPTKVRAYSKGHGWYLNTGFDSPIGSLMGTFWNGMSFISSEGMPLYQSVSQQINNAGFIEQSRRLLMLRYSYQKKLIPNLYLDFRFEPFMDINVMAESRKIEFSNSLFLTYKEEFRISKIKRK